MIPAITHLFSMIMALQFDPFFDLFFGFFGFFWIFIIVFIVIWVVIMVIVFNRICKAQRASQRMYDASKIPITRTQKRHYVRETLPTECPECDAPIKYNEVKWVGPRRAECPYCGNVLELQEEEVFESC